MPITNSNFVNSLNSERISLFPRSKEILRIKENDFQIPPKSFGYIIPLIPLVKKKDIQTIYAKDKDQEKFTSIVEKGIQVLRILYTSSTTFTQNKILGLLVLLGRLPDCGLTNRT